LKTEQRE